MSCALHISIRIEPGGGCGFFPAPSNICSNCIEEMKSVCMSNNLYVYSRKKS